MLGCDGSYPGPGRRGQRLPGAGRDDDAVARRRSRAPSPASSRSCFPAASTPSSSPTSTPTTGPTSSRSRSGRCQSARRPGRRPRLRPARAAGAVVLRRPPGARTGGRSSPVEPVEVGELTCGSRPPTTGRRPLRCGSTRRLPTSTAPRRATGGRRSAVRRRRSPTRPTPGPDWSVEALGSGIGTLLCEATYTAEHEGVHQHLSGRQAGTMAAAARVGARRDPPVAYGGGRRARRRGRRGVRAGRASGGRRGGPSSGEQAGASGPRGSGRRTREEER